MKDNRIQTFTKYLLTTFLLLSHFYILSQSKSQQLFDSLFNMGKYYAKTNFDSASFFCNQLIKLSESLNDKDKIQLAYQQMGNINFYAHKQQLAIENKIYAGKLNKELNNTFEEVKCYVEIAFIYNSLGKDYSKQTKQWLDLANKISENQHDSIKLMVYDKMGAYYYGIGNYRTSLREYSKLIACLNQLKKPITAGYYNNIGLSYQKLKQLDSSDFFLKKALKLSEQESTPRTKGIVLINIAIGEYLKNELNQSIKTTQTAITLLNITKNSNKLIEAYQNLVNCYKKLELTDSVLKYTENYHSLKDSVYNEQKRKELQEIENKEEREKIINSLNEEKTKQFIYLIISIFIFLIALILIVAYLTITNKNKKLLQNEQLIKQNLSEKEMLLGEVHHRVKNNLQLISSLLDLQLNGLTDEQAIKAITESRNRVLTMSLLHQKLYSGGEFGYIETTAYFTEIISMIDSSMNLDKKVIIEKDIEEIKLLIDYAVPIGLISNEIITNCYKYAFVNNPNPTLKISFKKIDSALVFIVIDNGKGIDNFNEHASFGLKLIKSLARQLKGEINVAKENGTKFEIIIRKFKLYE